MKAENELLRKKKELKEAISDGMEKIIPGYFFTLVGNALARMFRLAKRPNWIANAVILGVLLFLPGLLIAAVTGEIYQWEASHLRYVGYALAGCLVPILCHLNIAYNLLPGIREHVVDSIQDMQALNDLSAWLRCFWTKRHWMVTLAGIGIPLLAIRIGSRFALGKFIGFGIMAIELVLITFVVSPLHVVLKMLTLPPLMRGHKSELDVSLKPEHAEVRPNRVAVLKIYLYHVIANTAIFALVTTLCIATWQMLLDLPSD